MKTILVLGAGFVAAPLVDYLCRKQYQLTVASHLKHEADAVADRFSNVTPIQLDVSDTEALANVIRAHDMVVSFVPFIFHETVAEVCIAERRNLVTASYETERMRSLDSKARAAGVTIVNEIGLDPGIDHLSAMKIFDEIESKGEILQSYVSWCGGLPAMSANNNPLGYKFSWSPKSVLLALLNDAKYILDDTVEIVPAEQLLTRINSIEITDELTLEGYANRDSTTYVDSYHIPDAHKVLRGTLRYPGFCEIMQQFKALGLFDQTQEMINQWQGKSWCDYILYQSQQSMTELRDSLSEHSRSAVDFLRLLQTDLIIMESETILDSFCAYLTDKLSYEDGESDMIVMQHEFISQRADGQQLRRTSTLVIEGEPDGYSAMAKTVGTPAAIMTDMLIQKELTRTGVLLPMNRDIYDPILERLAVEGIAMEERTYTI